MHTVYVGDVDVHINTHQMSLLDGIILLYDICLNNRVKIKSSQFTGQNLSGKFTSFEIDRGPSVRFFQENILQMLIFLKYGKIIKSLRSSNLLSNVERT